jgi:hypothetical protein
VRVPRLSSPVADANIRALAGTREPNRAGHGRRARHGARPDEREDSRHPEQEPVEGAEMTWPPRQRNRPETIVTITRPDDIMMKHACVAMIRSHSEAILGRS